ncbi:MAG: hypothetical protein WC791_03960 [Candidatus Paceibacterota bacterium]|jgi:GGDEF domain-containing protein
MESKSTPIQPAIEQERTPEKVFQDIVEKRRLHDQESLPTVEGIKDLMNGLPTTVANKLMKEAEYLRERAANDVAFRELFLREAQRTWSQYTVERFGMPSKMFAKEEVKHAIDNLLSREPALESLKKIARISIDLNGLKAVNDLNRGDHTKGDVFLEIVARTIKSEKMVSEFKSRGISLVPTSDGGDEFGVIVVSEKALDTGTLEEIMKNINAELLSEDTTRELRNVLDFNNEIVASAFAGVTPEEWAKKSAEEREEEIRKAGIPRDFAFKAHASMGAATLYDAFSTMKGEKHEIEKGDSYERILDKLMGGVFTKSDTLMQENKETFKKEIQESENPNEKFLSMVYSRNEAERELSRELDKKNHELKECIEGR